MTEPPAGPQASPIAQVPVRRLRNGEAREEIDQVAVEAPLELRFGGHSVVLLRTPGNDEELALGFLRSEGLLLGREDVVDLRRPQALAPPLTGNVLELELRGPERAYSERRFAANAGCGACGKASLAELEVLAAPITSDFQAPAELLASLPERLRTAQPWFDATGGLHAAGLFDASGMLLCAREDIGRHNAVDKLVGWALARPEIDLGRTIIAVSGRLGYEIAQKAVVAGVPIVVSVGAVSSLAVEIAQRFGLALAAFTKPGELNVFGRTGRVLRHAPSAAAAGRPAGR